MIYVEASIVKCADGRDITGCCCLEGLGQHTHDATVASCVVCCPRPSRQQAVLLRLQKQREVSQLVQLYSCYNGDSTLVL